MTGSTAPSTFRLVYVQIMEVLRPVSKECQRLSPWFFKDPFLMALEAEAVNFRIIGGIELSRILFVKEPEIVFTVRVVAGAAVLVLHRAVLLRIFCKEFLEIGQLLAVVIDHVIFTMAADTKVKRQINKQMLHVCPVGIVAIDAGLVFNRSIVFHLGFGGHRLHIGMTTETRCIDIIRQKLGVFGVVGIVAIDAGCIRRGMGELARQELLEILMAIQAGFINRLKEWTGILRVLFHMAQNAVPVGKGRMQRSNGHTGRERSGLDGS